MEFFELILWTFTGIIIGSFVNVCIDRMTLQFSKPEIRLNLLKYSDTSSNLSKKILSQSLSIFYPIRSFCFLCDYQLKWFENIPVFSYFFCKGICRKCNAPIGSRVILNEMSHGLVYLINGYLIDGLIYPFFISISFSFFWFLVNFFVLKRNFKKIEKNY